MKLHVARQGSGRPIVLLHGLFGSSNNWTPLMQALKGEFELIAPDLRNHGRSPHDAKADIEAMASDLNELLDALKLQRVFLLGHSLGGRVAMRFALDQPARVDRLLISDMSPKEYGPLFPEVFSALNALDLGTLSSRGEADERLQASLPDAALRAFLLTNLARDGQNHFKWKMNLAALDAARANFCAEIRAPEPYPGPALFVRGGNSNYVLDADVDRIKKLFPAARLEAVSGAGHWVHVDQPAEFAAGLRRHFRID